MDITYALRMCLRLWLGRILLVVTLICFAAVIFNLATMPHWQVPFDVWWPKIYLSAKLLYAGFIPAGIITFVLYFGA